MSAESDESGHTITISLDGEKRKVLAGAWIVRDLKSRLEINPAKVMAEITPQGLKGLDDGATIEPHDNDEFMTHARSGGSSR